MFAVSFATFTLVALSPIDPVQANVGQQALLGMSEAKRAQLAAHWDVGVPLLERYGTWLVDALHGDWGTSLRFNAPVPAVVGESLQRARARSGGGAVCEFCRTHAHSLGAFGNSGRGARDGSWSFKGLPG